MHLNLPAKGVNEAQLRLKRGSSMVRLYQGGMDGRLAQPKR